MKNLANKTALVTGGSRGIGAAIAIKLAQQGANVVITYQHAADKAEAVVQQITAGGGNALAIQADSVNAQAVVDAVNRAAQTFGGLDILVNNAGVAHNNHISNFTLDDFEQTIAVNVRAVFAASQAALLHMPNGGRIIGIGSCLAERVQGTGWTLYSMSKAALIGFTKALARDVGPQGVTVNVVHPGPVDTDMNPAGGVHADYQRGLMAIPYFGKPSDIAALVAHLAGPDGGYITGAGFTIDGGTNI